LADSYALYLRGEPFLKDHGIKPQHTLGSFLLINGAKDAYFATKSFADGSGDFIFLLIYGGTGNGKTHLCNGAAITLMERGVITKLYDVSELMSLLRGAIDHGAIEEEVKTLKEVPCLILDDFKPEYETQWALNRLEEVINYRYGAYLLTMVTTNQDLPDLPDRIVSRFSDIDRSKKVLNSAPDYRRRAG